MLQTDSCAAVDSSTVEGAVSVSTEPDGGDSGNLAERQKEVESENAKTNNVAPVPKGRRTKSQMKQELLERKVQEKQRELRRQRTRNRKYMSDDFTSIFTENKDLLSSSGYVDDEKKEVVGGSDFIQEEIVETGIGQSIEIAECVEVGSSSSSDGDSRAGSPYSEISNSTVYSISSDSEAESSADEKQPEKASAKADYKTSRKSREQSPEYQQPSAKRRRLSPQPKKTPLQSTDRLQRYSPHSSPRNRRESPHGRSRDDSTHGTRQKDGSPHGSGKKRREDAVRGAVKSREDTSYDSGSRDDVSRNAKPRDELPRSGGVRMRQVGGSRRHYYYDVAKPPDSSTVAATRLQPDTSRETSRRRLDPSYGNKETKTSGGKVSDGSEQKLRYVLALVVVRRCLLRVC